MPHNIVSLQLLSNNHILKPRENTLGLEIHGVQGDHVSVKIYTMGAIAACPDCQPVM